MSAPSSTNPLLSNITNDKCNWVKTAYIYLTLSMIILLMMDIFGLMVADNPNAFTNETGNFNGNNICNEDNPTIALSVSPKTFFLTIGIISIISVLWLIIIVVYLLKIIPNKPQHSKWKWKYIQKLRG